ERHPPGFGAQEAEQAVEERGLARAVRADETHSLTLADVQAHILESHDPAEVLRDPDGFEQRGPQAHAGTSSRCCSSVGGGPSWRGGASRASRRLFQARMRSMLRRLPNSTAPSGCLA